MLQIKFSNGNWKLLTSFVYIRLSYLMMKITTPSTYATDKAWKELYQRWFFLRNIIENEHACKKTITHQWKTRLAVLLFVIFKEDYSIKCLNHMIHQTTFFRFLRFFSGSFQTIELYLKYRYARRQRFRWLLFSMISLSLAKEVHFCKSTFRRVSSK